MFWNRSKIWSLVTVPIIRLVKVDILGTMDMDIYPGNHTTPVWTIGRKYTLGNNLGDQIAYNGLTDEEAIKIVLDELSDESSVVGHAYKTLQHVVEFGGSVTPWIGFLRSLFRYYVPRGFDPRTADALCWDQVLTSYDRIFELTGVIATGSVSKIIVSATPSALVYNAIEFNPSETPIATTALFLHDGIIATHGEVISRDWSNFLQSVRGFRGQ